MVASYLDHDLNGEWRHRPFGSRMYGALDWLSRLCFAGNSSIPIDFNQQPLSFERLVDSPNTNPSLGRMTQSWPMQGGGKYESNCVTFLFFSAPLTVKGYQNWHLRRPWRRRFCPAGQRWSIHICIFSPFNFGQTHHTKSRMHPISTLERHFVKSQQEMTDKNSTKQTKQSWTLTSNHILRD